MKISYINVKWANIIDCVLESKTYMFFITHWNGTYNIRTSGLVPFPNFLPGIKAIL